VPAVGPGEVLTHDWNKYNHSIIATGGVDKIVRTFDIRNPTGGPVSLMEGHGYAVRRLAWSPHESDVLITASYDMTVRVWTDGSKYPNDPTLPGMRGRQIGLMNRHTEFATGVDWCLFGQGWVASVGWDERVLLWDARPFFANRF
jgi:peroxin-7